MSVSNVGYSFVLPMNRPMMMSANARKHWSARHRITKYWRHLAHVLAKQSKIPALAKARIVVTFSFGDQRRRDSANFYPVAKAITDGIVDAGVLVDDSDKYVEGPDSRRHDPATPMIRVDILPQDQA